MKDLEYFGHTDIGTKREANEDNYLCVDLSPEIPPKHGPAALLVVADGIGGHAGGAVASGLAAESLKEHFLLRLKDAADPPSWLALLGESFQKANEKIFEKISEDLRLTGMGTTLVAAVATRDKAYVANIGDSRAYLVRGEEIIRVTQDHSWVAEQQRLNIMSSAEIEHSPFKHMITRSLGFEAKARVDLFEEDLEGGDFLMLCSDGLYAVVPDKEILRIFRKSSDLEKICRKLLKLAAHSGSHDNITAVVARFGRPEKKAKRSPSATVRLGTPPSFESDSKDKGDGDS
jgi:protein phosphatase